MLNDAATGTFSVQNIFNTDISTFFGTKFFQYQFQNFFPIPNFTNTCSKTFFWYEIFPVPPEKMKNSGYQYLYDTATHYKSSKFLNFSDENQFRYEIFPIPVPTLFPVPNFSDTGSDTILVPIYGF